MNEPLINIKSLKEQVYDYLQDLIQKKELRPGSSINMDAFSRRLGISKTPLRDALIQLEMEGFVTIAPRRGIYVNSLSMEEIREFYQVLGALEAAALSVSFPFLTPEILSEMNRLNRMMKEAVEAGDFNRFHRLNLQFHDQFLDLCGNRTLQKMVKNLKKRLYDFPKRENWIKEWEVSSIQEHQQFIDFLKKGNLDEACRHIRDVHWSFQVQERFIRLYYFPDQ